jgi:hypothetical protein
MGLDMYLFAKKYLWHSYGENKSKDQDYIDAVKGLKIPGTDEMKIKQLEFEAAYWRKANAIHQWFVTNVQDGTDDCGDYSVSKEQLKELSDICHLVLLDRNRAIELLPPQGGFFFGSTDLDEYYYNDIEDTAEKIDKLLATPGIETLDFYYHSSW